MKLGLQLGYWGAQPPAGRRRARRRGRGGRLRRDLHRRGLGLRRVHAAGLVGPRDLPGPARHLDRADVRPHADLDRDARADPRPPHRRPGRARHGRERPAGRRGLVRPAVRQAAGPHPRGRRHHPPGAGPRGAGDQRRPALPAAVRRRGLGRARQAAQADRAPAARRHPDLARRRGPQERRADRRDRRRLDPDLLHAEVGRHVPAVARRGLRRGRAPGVPATTSRSPPPATSRSPRRRGEARRVIDAHQADRRALHGRHGRQGAELPQAGLRPDGLRGPSPTRCRSSSSPASRTRPPR